MTLTTTRYRVTSPATTAELREALVQMATEKTTKTMQFGLLDPETGEVRSEEVTLHRIRRLGLLKMRVRGLTTSGARMAMIVNTSPSCAGRPAELTLIHPYAP